MERIPIRYGRATPDRRKRQTINEGLLDLRSPKNLSTRIFSKDEILDLRVTGELIIRKLDGVEPICHKKGV